MDLYEVMRTTFAAREFQPGAIPDQALWKILDNARFAPSGGNRQGWRVISVRAQADRDRLIEWMTPAAKRYFGQVARGENPWNTVNPTSLSAADIAVSDPKTGFLKALANAPTVLLVFVDLRVVASFDSELDRVGVTSGASIYPFVWNILLSARAAGYGGTLTTFITEQDAAVRRHFGVPDYMATCALLPMGKPVKQLTKLARKPVQEIAWHDRWQGDEIASPE